MSVSTVAHTQARRSVQNTQVEASFSQLGQFPNDKDTFLPGRWVDPRKLENVLNDLFDDQYAVSVHAKQLLRGMGPATTPRERKKDVPETIVEGI
ncbi:hypothetical protein NW755_005180 [Fusarium falciforme]|uniref:Uncharacterized protein n=1 Tax=Fusarium falciforme TaxID=195108 RepID=A0A9W8RBR4_9HYPO|nr:hypothetical protein NW755_005180 [Fusarium falciforme]